MIQSNIKNVYVCTRHKIPLKSTREDIQLTLGDDTSKELSLLQSVIIENTDGIFHTLKEISGYSYGSEFVCVEKAKESFVVDWSLQFLREGVEAKEEEVKFTSDCLQNLFENKDNKGYNIYLAEKPYEDYGYSHSFTEVIKHTDPITKFYQDESLFKEGKIKISDQTLELDLLYPHDLSKLRLLGGVFYSMSTGELYYTKEDVIREKIKSLFSSDRLKFKLKSLSFNLFKDDLKRSVSYESSFFENPFEKIEKVKEIMPIEIKDEIKIENQGNKKFTVKLFPNESERAQVYSSSHVAEKNKSIEDALKLLLGMKDGVSGFLGKEPSHMAINGPKRLSELKLLKSSGFFTYLLNYILKEKTFDQSKEEEFWKETTLLISNILPHEYKKPELSLMISPYFKDYVHTVLKELSDQQKHNEVFIQQDKIEVVDHKEVIFNFLKPLFSMFKQFYKLNIYRKDNYAEFSVTLDNDREKGVYLDVHFPFSIDIGVMMKQNTCVIDEEEIQALSSDAIKVKFDIKEQLNSSGKDWFDLDPKYFFDGKEITEEAAKDFKSNSVVRYGDKLYYISGADVPAVKWLNYFWERVGKGKKSTEEGDKLEPSYFRAHVLDVLALRQAGMAVEGDARWEAVAKEYDSINEEAELNQDKFEGVLKPFQHRGVSWLYQLYRLGLGGILADDMGLGKTIQILSFLNHLKNKAEEKDKKHLVVVPTSLVYNWISEAEKFTPSLTIEAFKKENKEDLERKLPNLLVTTYGMLSEHQDFFLKEKWGVVIFDEAQQLKNIKSMRSDISRKLQASMKICLSGTPMENHYGEYFSLVDLSVPGALGDYSSFMKIYGPRKVQAGKVEIKDIEYLKLKTKPLVLRRSKTQVLKELPEKTESVVKLNFDDKQKEIYRNVALVWNTKIQNLLNSQGESKSQLQMFAALMKLRQICSCPDVIEGTGYDQLSPKLSLVVDRIEELLNAKKSVLVFTNFIITLDKIKKELQRRNLEALSITGKDSQKKREEVLRTFNSGDHKALVMTLKTGGVGLNLTKASYIIHVEPWWNPAAENQGTDRVYRMGQKNSVHVYRYIMKNSIEEKIQELKKTKQEAFNALLSEDSNGAPDATFSGGQGLSKKDFEFLLS